MRRRVRLSCAAVCAVAVLALTVALPAQAQTPLEAPAGVADASDDDSVPAANAGVGGGSASDINRDVETTAPGPVANTGAAEFDTVWTDRGVPDAVVALEDDENVELWTHAADDASVFMAALIIDNSDASTKYRFERAVPAGYSAKIQNDGSVRFYDDFGKEAGGIMAPWAVDADGKDVLTHFEINGRVIVQTVDHRGASYPVVADPFWVAVFVVVKYAALRCASSIPCTAAVTTAVTAGPHYVREAWRHRDKLNADRKPYTGGPIPPANKCNLRHRSNRPGC